MTRSMGVRDGLLGVGLLQALRTDDASAARAWLAYGAAAGVVDAAATLLAWRSLSGSGRAFLAFICTAAAVDGVLAGTIAESL